MKRYLDRRQTTKWLRVNEKTLRRWVASGRLLKVPGSGGQGQRLRFDPAAVSRFQGNEDRVNFLSQVILAYLKRQEVKEHLKQAEVKSEDNLCLKWQAELSVVFPVYMRDFWRQEAMRDFPHLKESLAGTLRPSGPFGRICFPKSPKQLKSNLVASVQEFARKIVTACQRQRQRRRFGKRDEVDFLAALFVCAEHPLFPRLPGKWAKTLEMEELHPPYSPNDIQKIKTENDYLDKYLAGDMRRTEKQRQQGVMPLDFDTVRGSQLYGLYYALQGRNTPNKSQIAKVLNISRVQTAELLRRLRDAMTPKDSRTLAEFIGIAGTYRLERLGFTKRQNVVEPVRQTPEAVSMKEARKEVSATLNVPLSQVPNSRNELAEFIRQSLVERQRSKDSQTPSE